VVELQRPRLYAKAREWRRLSGLVDDPHRDAEPGQPEREDEPGGSAPTIKTGGRSSLPLSLSLPSAVPMPLWVMVHFIYALGHNRSFLERDEEKCETAFRPPPALNYGNRSR